MKFLHKPIFLILALFLVILLSLKHNFEVYSQIIGNPELLEFLEHYQSYEVFYTLLMMLAFDFAILMLAVRGNRNAAITYSIFTFILNAYFYLIKIANISEWHQAIPGLIFAGMTAYSIYYFSEEFALSFRKQDFLTQLKLEVEKLSNRLETALTQNSGLRMDLIKLGLSLEHTEKDCQMHLSGLEALSLEHQEALAKIQELEQGKYKLEKRLQKAKKEEAKSKEELIRKFEGKSSSSLQDAKKYRERQLEENDLNETKRINMKRELAVIEELLSQPA